MTNKKLEKWDKEGKYVSAAELFDKELIRMVVERDFKTYLKRKRDDRIKGQIAYNVEKNNFDDLKVKFLKPGIKFGLVHDQ